MFIHLELKTKHKCTKITKSLYISKVIYLFCSLADILTDQVRPIIGAQQLNMPIVIYLYYYQFF